MTKFVGIFQESDIKMKDDLFQSKSELNFLKWNNKIFVMHKFCTGKDKNIAYYKIHFNWQAWILLDCFIDWYKNISF